MEIICNDLQDTISLAVELSTRLSGKDIVLLNGELGAGKTTFTKALAAALGVKATVTSPTFAFMKAYDGSIKIYHYDMYRAESEEELEELGIAECLEEDALCVIEWNKFKSFPHHKRIITIDISKLADNDCARIFRITGL